MYMGVLPAYMYLCAVSSEARRGFWIPENWSYPYGGLTNLSNCSSWGTITRFWPPGALDTCVQVHT